MIEYVCDSCGKTGVATSEAYGTGVLTTEFNHDINKYEKVVGKAFNYIYKDICLRIMPEMEFGEHVCRECIGKGLRELVDTVFPLPTLVAKEAIDWAAESLVRDMEETNEAEGDGVESTSPGADVHDVSVGGRVHEPSADVTPIIWVNNDYDRETGCLCTIKSEGDIRYLYYKRDCPVHGGW